MTRVLVLGDYRQSLTIARSLASRGDTVVAAIGPGHLSHLGKSSAVEERWRTDLEVEDPGFGVAVRGAIDAYSIDVVFPVGDREIAWMAANEEQFSVPVAYAGPTTTRECQDKPALLAMCDEVGVGRSASRVVETLAGLRDVIADLGLPAIVKSNDPLMRVRGRKGVVLRGLTDVEESFSNWPVDHESLIVQRYVDGPRHNLYFVAERGEIRGLGEVEILRTDAVDGTGYAVDGRTVRPHPTLLAETERLVAELKYHGVGCTQFLVAPGGETCFLELNPRLGANFAVVDRAGLRLARHAVDIALERPVESVTTRVGVRYAWTVGDLEGLVVAIRRREVGFGGAVRWVGRALRTMVGADVHVTWSWADPRPGANMLWRSVVRPALGAILRRG